MKINIFRYCIVHNYKYQTCYLLLQEQKKKQASKKEGKTEEEKIEDKLQGEDKGATAEGSLTVFLLPYNYTHDTVV